MGLREIAAARVELDALPGSILEFCDEAGTDGIRIAPDSLKSVQRVGFERRSGLEKVEWTVVACDDEFELPVSRDVGAGNGSGLAWNHQAAPGGWHGSKSGVAVSKEEKSNPSVRVPVSGWRP